MNPRLMFFSAGGTGGAGAWRIRTIRPVIGESLPTAEYLTVAALDSPAPCALWRLQGVASNERYVTQEEKTQLIAKQEGLGRVQATFGALLPIKKSAAWWLLTPDARRRIFEEQSHHTQIGLDYLPAIARKLYHCRDLSTAEPFDFLTWFEFEPQHEPTFDQLLAALRAAPEWSYVEREVDIRLEKGGVELMS
jgi:Chlorite dismutase